MTGLPIAAVFLYLEGRGLSTRYPDVAKVAGPADADALRAGKGRVVVATRGGGPGFILEQAFDTVTVTIRTVGLQDSYVDGEAMADALDELMLAPGNVQVGTHRALYVARAGGGPVHILTDRARRSHFSCSYVIPVASGL